MCVADFSDLAGPDLIVIFLILCVLSVPWIIVVVIIFITQRRKKEAAMTSIPTRDP